MYLDRADVSDMLMIMRFATPRSESESPAIGGGSGWLIAGAIAFAVFLFWLSLTQGLNWDEPWLVTQARLFAWRQPTEAFKPLAGVLALPVIGIEHPWLVLRMMFVGWQLLLAWVVWRLLPTEGGWLWRCMGVALLWIEPTFRERALEARTEVPAILAIGVAILIWHRRLGKIPRWVAGSFLAFAAGIAPKSVFWILPWIGFAAWKALGEDRQARVDLLRCLGILVVGFLALWGAGAVWTQRGLVGAIHGLVLENHQALSGAGVFPAHSRAYLLQVLWIGWPFYVLALVGLASGAFRRLGPMQLHWLWCGILPWVSVPIYSGAFPYHFVGLVFSLLPLASIGLWQLHRSFGLRYSGAAFLICLIAELIATAPVLSGPRLGEQAAIAKFAQTALPKQAGYLDGVGMLYRSQSAPFLTSMTMNSPEVDQILDRWVLERMSLIVLNGRSELVLQGKRLDWVKEHFIRIHPNLLVLGTIADADQLMDTTWDLPWDAEFLFRGSTGWTWWIGTQSIKDGERVRLSRGVVHLQGRGLGIGRAMLHLPVSGHGPQPLQPFFLPFQRN